MENLLMHCGGQHVTRDDVAKVSTPTRTRNWVPVPHQRMLDLVESTITDRGFQIIDSAHGFWGDGARYFGLMELANGHVEDDYNLVLGLRNSHDKTFPAGICVGSCVLVCDNLSIGAEITLARKHTQFVLRDLPYLVRDAISGFTQLRVDQHNRIEAYKHKRINNRAAHDLIIRAIDNKIIPVTKVPGVLSEWREPSHNEFTNHGSSLWRLHNAFSESWKGANLNTLPRRSQRLHQLLDQVCGFQLAA
jgi:hypothetical protein